MQRNDSGAAGVVGPVDGAGSADHRNSWVRLAFLHPFLLNIGRTVKALSLQTLQCGHCGEFCGASGFEQRNSSDI
jgi:hypothetical protein